MASLPSSEWKARDRWSVAAAALVAAPVLLVPGMSSVLVTLPAVVVTLAALMRWPKGRVGLATAALCACAASLAVDALYSGPGDIAFFWLPLEACALWALAGRVARRLTARRLTVVALVMTMTLLALPLRITLRMSPGWDAWAVLAVTLLLPAIAAAAVGLYLRSLDDRRRRAVAAARRAQRLRMAGDLHDFVAHEVTGIVLEAQAAGVANYDDIQTRALLARIEEAGIRALESMDHTIEALREPDGASTARHLPVRLYTVADLGDLVDRFSGGGCVRTVLQLSDELSSKLGPERDSAAYMVVLEALTNVRRHAPSATDVAVSVAAVDEGVVVTVTDNGGGQPQRRVGGGGTGLIGLSERIAALGGRLTARPTLSGWETRCVLPAEHGRSAIGAGDPHRGQRTGVPGARGDAGREG